MDSPIKMATVVSKTMIAMVFCLSSMPRDGAPGEGDGAESISIELV